MRVHKRQDTGQWRLQFKHEGRRFSFPLEATTQKAAIAEGNKLWAKFQQEQTEQRKAGKQVLTLDQAADRYWEEVGQHHADALKTWTDLKRVVEYIGPSKRLDQITDNDVSAMVAWRRAQPAKGKKEGVVAPATVNRSTTEVLKKLFTRAKTAWRYMFPEEPNWRAHILKEPEGITRELKLDEEAALREVARSDYAPWIEFALRTGWRRAETLIKWEHVDWESRSITTTGKRGLKVTTPITDAVAAILEGEMGKHDEFVFTFVAKRTKGAFVRGMRYPISYEGGKTEWQRLVQRAGVKDFRFHDLRHTVGTRLLRDTGNLALVQKALGHKDVKTTSRYAHVTQTDLARGLQSITEGRTWKETGTPKGTPDPEAPKSTD